MKKILFMALALFFTHTQVLASELKIISREEWGANEDYTDSQSEVWSDIFVKREERRIANLGYVPSAAQKAKNKANSILASKRISYVNKNFASRYATTGKQYYNGTTKLVWPITKIKKVDTILLHHTYSEYESSLEGVRNILKFHGISRQWGDIGYNFIIGYDGEIYEGRLGGDYTMGSHSFWNNYGSMGIAMLGNYDEREMNEEQKKSLNSLLSHLIYKYDISMQKKVPLHELCTDCTHGLTTKYYSPIAGHKDGGHTTCPGENIYDLIPDLNEKFRAEQIRFNTLFQKLVPALATVETEKLQQLGVKVKLMQTRKNSERNKHILKRLSTTISNELKNR